MREIPEEKSYRINGKPDRIMVNLSWIQNNARFVQAHVLSNFPSKAPSPSILVSFDFKWVFFFRKSSGFHGKISKLSKNAFEMGAHRFIKFFFFCSIRWWLSMRTQSCLLVMLREKCAHQRQLSTAAKKYSVLLLSMPHLPAYEQRTPRIPLK